MNKQQPISSQQAQAEVMQVTTESPIPGFFLKNSQQNRKLQVIMAQINTDYGGQVNLPYSVGTLQAYAEKFTEIRENVEFCGFIFKRDSVADILDRIGSADLVAFSCYMWNWQLNIAVAKELRKKNPNIFLVFGGPHIPNNMDGFFAEHAYIDFACHEEGEATFYNILTAIIRGDSFTNITGLSFYDRESEQVYHNKRQEKFIDLDEIPSPYLTGVFDSLMTRETGFRWMALWESNRGCPYGCTFCDWGSDTLSKVRRFSMGRLQQEIAWFGEKNIAFLFGCDANFGILPRDYEIAQMLVDIKKKTGFPEKFRVSFAKKTNEKVLDIAKKLDEEGLNKGISISLQSLNSQTLNYIKRTNINSESFASLQAKFMFHGIPTFTELVLCLPGESYDSFLDGVAELLDNGQHYGINIFFCSILPNSDIARPAYQKEHGIKSVKIPIFLAHRSRTSEVGFPVENDLIVYQTNSMPVADWKRVYIFSWTVQCFHVLGMLQYTSIILNSHLGISYRDFYETLTLFARNNPDSLLGEELKIIDTILDNILAGRGFDQFIDGFTDANWPTEEASFLRLSRNIETFYEEASSFLALLIDRSGISLVEENLLEDLILFQKSILKRYDRVDNLVIEVGFNFLEYVQGTLFSNPVPFQSGRFRYRVLTGSQWGQDPVKFSREVVWYGRKGGKFYFPVEQLQVDE
ncbi:MAG: cobalamin-dependent protein [Magnetococcales bacterium]|nr:cobalamin-dependent protein [Magnetococcales bacterium]